MARRYTALVVTVWSVVALGAAGCDGDDTNPAVPDAGTDATVPPHDSGTSGEASAQLCVPVDAAAYSAADIALGKSIVVAHHCQVCHGESLSGNIDGLPSLGYGTAYPPNLTPDEATGLGCWTDYQIETAFLYGIDDQATVLCPPMPRFGEFEDGGGISADQAPAVVAFLRNVPAIVNQVPDSPNCTFFPPEDGGAGSEDSGTPPDAGHRHRDAGPDAASEDGGEDGGSLVDSGDATTETDSGDATTDLDAGDAAG